MVLTCRVLKISPQVYYRWLTEPVTNAELDQAYRANALFDAHRDDPEFGYRYLHEEAVEAGQPMAARTAWRICSDNGWWSAFAKRRSKNGMRPGPPVHDDLVQRDFTAAGPNELWLTDITEHWTAEGKLYVCAIKDVFSRGIVGYSIDSRMQRLGRGPLPQGPSPRLRPPPRHPHPRARAWLHVIWRCSQDGVAYDPAQHRALQTVLAAAA